MTQYNAAAFDREDYMFVLEIMKQTERQFPSEVVVKVKNHNSLFHFEVTQPYYPAVLSIRRSDLSQWTPLLENFCDNGETPTLVGTAIDNKFYVTDIYKANCSRSERLALRRCIDCIRNAVPNVQKPTTEGEYTLSKLSEFEMFYKVCGHTLPANLQDWVDRTIYIVKTQTSDKVSHALMALKLICNINWNPPKIIVPSEEEIRSILDSSLCGMNAVKDQMLDVFAQIRHSGRLPKWGLLLNGAAGIGKSTIAKLFAKILGLGCLSVDFSSLCDMEAVSGTSRIYDNGKAGIIIEKLFEIRSSQAVMLVGELDKAGKKNSDAVSPSDVLLTILDKLGFMDTFIEESIPTDNIFCVATCNDTSKISKPVLDRFFVIDIPAYSVSEKRQIWSTRAFPDAKKRASIAEDSLTLSEEAESILLSDYATEAGARDLEKYAERFTGHFCRCADSTQMTLDVGDIRDILGPGNRITRHFSGAAGLANTVIYHDGYASFVLIEASVKKGSGKFKTLGISSEQQKAFCEVAYECVCNTSSYDMSKVDVAVFTPHRLPDTPKNFIGCAVFAAISSAMTGQCFETSKTAFLGGCDLYGNLYFDSNSLAPTLKILERQPIEVLYAPLGTGGLATGEAGSIAVIEAPTAQMLIALAGGMRNKK